MINKRLAIFITMLAVVGVFGVVLVLRDIPVRAAPSQPVEMAFVPTPASTSTAVTNATVVRVVDGDTIVAKLDAEDAEWTIRFLGINTPETVDPRKPVQCFGKEASYEMKHLLPTGTRIRLEGDPHADEKDKYGRLLRNVILADGTDVNAFMVREGFAQAYLSFPLGAARKKELRGLQAEAASSSRGLWSPRTCNGKSF